MFVVALVASLGIGLAIHSAAPGDDEPQTVARNAGATPATPARPAPQPEATAPVVEPAGPAETAAPVVVTADVPAEPAAPVTYAEAEAAYLDGDWDEAVFLYESFTAENPENAWGHYMLGLSHRRAGDLERASVAFRRSLRVAPQHVKSLVNLGRTMLDQGLAGDALPYLERAVEADGTNVAAKRVLARAQHTVGRREAAKATYLDALAIDESDAWSLNNYGLMLIEEERFADALPPLARACEVKSDVAVFHNNLGIALERSEFYGLARAQFERALQLDEDHLRASASLDRVAEFDAASDEPVLTELASAFRVVTEADTADAAPCLAPEDVLVATPAGGEGPTEE